MPCHAIQIEDFAEYVRTKTGTNTTDHDLILSAALKIKGCLPSLEALPEDYRNVITGGLRANFNLGQFLQGENIAASGIEFSKLALDQSKMGSRMISTFLFHTLIDIAGAAGHVTLDGSIVMTEPTFMNFRYGMIAVRQPCSLSLPTPTLLTQ